MANLILDYIAQLQCIVVQKSSVASGGAGSLSLAMCLLPAHAVMSQGLGVKKVGLSDLGPRVACSPLTWSSMARLVSIPNRDDQIVLERTWDCPAFSEFLDNDSSCCYFKNSCIQRPLKV